MSFALSEMQLSSSAFGTGDVIPDRYTGTSEDLSPPLSWADAPADTREFAIICHDPDAPLVKPGNYGFVHWVLYGIPGDISELPEGVAGYTQGVNDFGNSGYGGPMPPEAHGLHHYFFCLFALDAMLELPSGITMWKLLEHIEPRVIGMNRLVGVYER